MLGKIIGTVTGWIQRFRIPPIALVGLLFFFIFRLIFAEENWVWQTIKDAASGAGEYVREVSFS